MSMFNASLPQDQDSSPAARPAATRGEALTRSAEVAHRSATTARTTERAVGDAQRGIRVTATDLETGEESTAEVMDDYVIVCAGSAYLDGIVIHGNGTVQLTVKGVRRG